MKTRIALILAAGVSALALFASPANAAEPCPQPATAAVETFAAAHVTQAAWGRDFRERRMEEQRREWLQQERLRRFRLRHRMFERNFDRW